MRSERSDPEFILPYDAESKDNIVVAVPKSCMTLDQRVFLVCENNLEALMKFCISCGSPVSQIDRKKYSGTQITYYFTCLAGCDTRWSSQPTTEAVTGNKVII